MSDKTQVYVKPGQRVRVKGSYSEVMCHFGLAGKPVEIELVENSCDGRRYYMAQVWKDGKRFSGFVTYGEAGFYRDADDKFYTYAYDGPGDENPEKIIEDTTAMILEALGGAENCTVIHLGM
jgi:hypothetical protein